MKKLNWAFFGSSEFSIIVLNTLKDRGYIPSLIVTTEDKPSGRKMIVTPTVVKVWANKENIPCLQLHSLKQNESLEKILDYFKEGVDLFIVTHYGKMIPNNILEIPKHKTLNIHPSLLPKLRGPSPIKSAILDENETGVTIIRLDEEMDHGPIVSQKKIEVTSWPPYEEDLRNDLARFGANMLADILPDWISGKISETPQVHETATFCHKINKEDAEINLSENPLKNLRKIRAFHVWPGAYFYRTNSLGEKRRIIVKKARIENNELVLETVVPEGKKEMSYSDFIRGSRK